MTANVRRILKGFKKTELGETPDEWSSYKLSEIMEIIGGGTPKTSVAEYWGGQIPWLSVVDFGDSNRWVYKTDKTITQKGLEESSTKILRKGQLIISARGTVGEIAQLGCDMAFNQSCYGLDGKQSLVTNDFLYYLLKISVDDLKRNTHGAVFDTITRQTFDYINVAIPSLKQQRAIAKILSDFDEKIKLNNQMNKTLESIAQAIFKRWFVDFEFSGYEKTKFFNGLPEKWRKGMFGELAKIQPGFAFKSTDFISGGYKVIKIANIQNEIVDFNKSDHVSNTVFQSIDKKFYLVSGDVVIAMTGAEIGKIGIIPKNDKIMLLNQRVGKLVSDYYQWAYQVLKGAEIQGLIDGISSASSAQPNISNSDIEKTEVIIPDEQTLEHFCQIIDSFFHHLISNLGENQILSQIRDSLLPRLMSGKIRVKAEA
jgi:type I restriction enzyme S subunit